MAIEYCYQFNDMTVGPAVFNWTVLIFKEINHSSNNDFEIVNTIPIESCDLDATRCTPGQPLCCDDMTLVSEFDLSVNFTFGVTESAQGNTPGATLLGFHDSLAEYRVNTIRRDKASLPLTIGSTIPSSTPVQNGLRMLWFVIGKLHDEYTVIIMP